VCTVLTLTLIRRATSRPCISTFGTRGQTALMDNLTPSDLFSPSKARQQRAQAQDWAHIDSWLSYKYSGRSVPTFERNEETLKVLRELSMANERADEERTVMQRLEREALKELDEV
jgi:HAUS augmin-like complex subunit 1